MHAETTEAEQEAAPVAAAPHNADAVDEAPARPARTRWFSPAHPAVAAILVWLVAAPVAFLLPRVPDYHGMGLRTFGLPLAAGLAAGAVLLVIGLRRPAPWLAGATAGVVSAWIVMILSTAMRGTPFPFFGLLGDAGRIAAMATRYSTTAASSDMMIAGLPSEYPPLFPWLVGRTSVLIDVEAWRLLGDFEVVTTGLAILVGFVLWQRLLPPWVALAVTVLGFMTFAIPAKAYEVVTLMAFVPWVLGTFLRPPRGRLHWAVSGVVFGFILMTYYGWVIFASFGIVAIAFVTWRKESDRKGYILYLLKVAGVAVAVASWFVIPLLWAKITIGGPTIADLYGTSNMLELMFPFLELTPLGILQLIGLIGLVWLRGRVWWAFPLLAIVAGAFAFRIFGAILFVLTEHTGLSQYTPRVYSCVLVMSGVLTLVHAVPKLVQRLSLQPPKGGVAVALTLVLAWAGFTFSMDWMPNFGGRYSDYTERAYREPYPDGSYAVGFENPTPWFPIDPIKREVERVKGPDPQVHALSVDERLWSFLPWHGYVGNDLGSSVSRTFERVDEVKRLAAISSPAEFDRTSQDLKYGKIDLFVLRRNDSGLWEWQFHQGFNQPEVFVHFQRSQFDPAKWEIIDDLPEDIVVAVRK